MSSDLGEFDTPDFDSTASRLDRPSSYLIHKARRNPNGYEELKKSLQSATVYVGHIGVYVTEEQIHELFSRCGKIREIIMGLNAKTQSPAGFCFVIFSSPTSALNAVKYLNGTMIFNNKMEIDLDPGFEDGRQFGRATDGSQKQYNSYQSRTRPSGGYGRSRQSNYRGGRRGGGGERGGYRSYNRNYENSENPRFTTGQLPPPPHQAQGYNNSNDNQYQGDYQNGYQGSHQSNQGGYQGGYQKDHQQHSYDNSQSNQGERTYDNSDRESYQSHQQDLPPHMK
ncbi:hypothetical protein LJB42_000297 [Komagataella kurtzmanii]|nr:hypothetical protein LJB42_000297 [Komagataella kurtzmanii]